MVSAGFIYTGHIFEGKRSKEKKGGRREGDVLAPCPDEAGWGKPRPVARSHKLGEGFWITYPW